METSMAHDPVCGMDVDPTTTSYKLQFMGETYYFCSRGCMLDFQDEPEKYLDADYKPDGMHDMGSSH
jgi:Cu+-exporting ATPase